MMIETKERMLEMNDCGEEYKLEQVRFILGSYFDRDYGNTSSKGMLNVALWSCNCSFE